MCFTSTAHFKKGRAKTMMKWHKETKVFCWADYFSEDGKWKAWCEDKIVATNRTKYNPVTRKREPVSGYKVWWVLQNLQTGEKVGVEFKTLKSAKEYAETNG
jgi:hypothetical protein